MIGLFASTVNGLEWISIDAGMGFALRFNASLDSSSAGKQPSTVFLSPSVAMKVIRDNKPGGVYFRPGVWLTWVPEEIYKGVARSSSHERAGAMRVLGFISDLHLGYTFNLEKFDIDIQGGPTVHIRIPTWKLSNSVAKPLEFWKAYYGKMQFIHLGFSSLMAYPLSDGKSLVFGISCMLPISNLWSGAPFAHGIQLALIGGIRFPLKKKRSESR